MSWAIAGNEVIPSNLTCYILPTMQNLDAALTATNLKIHVSTTITTGVLDVSFPSSQDVSMVVLETGWPSTGGAVGAMGENAMMYHNKVVAHVTSSTGTPKRLGMAIKTYLFALFNENLKPAGSSKTI
ncbi:putative glucan endo-1,3-beta-glucosidase GVI [Elaeis guineensis]|uniref:Glucan endo-1,3-beta-glucosidase GVI n=1 Tax=Elaeis guineensis var. tenera TaxID=51953 RepID=A0A6I9QL84_ELAGV|nr:putative glucan endo-1,3-beta-glucosidase GVI [Elaeis guineensis]